MLIFCEADLIIELDIQWAQNAGRGNRGGI